MNQNHSGLLTDNELQQLINAVENRGKITEKIPINIAPFSGLTNSELRHLRESWLEWNPDQEIVSISIPESIPCTSIRFTDGATGITSREKPCQICRESSAPDHRCWPKKKRTVYVYESRAYQQLKSVFEVYDEMPITEPSTPLRNLSREVLDEKINMTTLRNTHVRLLGERGLSVEHITEQLGHKSVEKLGHAPPYIRQILKPIDNDYGELTRPQTVFDFIKENGPLTRKQIGEQLGLSSPQDIVETLESESVIERVGKDTSKLRGKDPDLYDAVDGESLDQTCPICNEDFRSLRGRNGHKTKVHGG